MLVRDEDVLVDALVVGQQRVEAGLGVDAPDHGMVGALQYLGEGALAAAATVDARDAGDDAVAVQQRPHLARVQVDVLAALVRDQEAEAVGMRDHAPAHQVLRVDRDIALAPVEQHLAVADHGVHAAAQRLA